MPDGGALVDRLRRFLKEVVLTDEAWRASLRYIVLGTLGLSALIVILLLLLYRPSSRDVAIQSAVAAVAAGGNDVAAAPADGARAANSTASERILAVGASGGAGGVPVAPSIFPGPPGADDYRVPPQPDPLARGWVLSRAPQAAWSAGEISKYWIDPAKIGVDNLRDRNDQTITALLSEVP